MRMHSVESDVEVSCENADNFYMEMTPEALELLSAGAYKDRVLAPIREIAANAYDSHVAANKADVPFEVQLPTSLEPNFYIRDFGTGIDPAKFKKVYTGYFNSSKKDSNAYIGCMGIGSKSPFAYTDTFNVSNYWDGKVYIYSCYKDASRKPAVSLMGESETDECNGLKISFPVKKEDFYTFKEKATKAFQFYKVKPTFKGNQTTSFKEYNYAFLDENIGVLADKDYYYNTKSLVIMGNISYEIESNSIPNLDSVARAFIDHGIHLFVPIGAVSVAISRETLSFDEATINFLENYINDCIEKIKKKMENDVSHIKNIWEARVFCNENKSNILYSLLNSNHSKNDFSIFWNGQLVKDNIYLPNYIGDKPSVVELCSLTSKDEYSRYSSEKNIVTNGLRRRYVSHLFFKKECKYFVDDVGNGTYAAIRRHLESSDDKSVYLFSQDKGLSFLNQLEVPEDQIFYVSSIEKPERKPREKGPKKEKTLLQKYDSNYSVLKSEDVDIKTVNGIYFEQKYQSVKINGDFYSEDKFRSTIKKFFNLSMKEDVYTVRPSDKEKLKNKSNWKDGDEFLLNYLKGLTKIRELALYFKACSDNKFLIYINRYKHFFKTTSSIFQTTNMSKEFENAKNVVDKFLSVDSNSLVYNYISLVEFYEDKENSLSLEVDFNNFADKNVFSDLESKYPLFKYLSLDCQHDKNKAKELVNYINLVENSPNLSVIKDAV